MTHPIIATADLCDAHQDKLLIADPVFKDYGGVSAFHGAAATVRAFEDNTLVREALEEPGEGRVLVVDGGASLRCALVGDTLVKLAHDGGWRGIVIHGCIRDTQVIGTIAMGVKALNVCPKKSKKRGTGERDVVVHFAGVTIKPGDYVYVDADGVVVADDDLTVEKRRDS